ncbi:hypothetical protein IPF37_02830 [bacterium]|nr:MAG: hypothetical protein IPF37_02830 [bacterium]
MKKIIFLSIGLLFSSTQAADFNETEIIHVATELAQNSELVVLFHVLYEQGLEPERVIELLMQSDEMQAYARNTHYQRRQRGTRRREMIADALSMTAVALASLVLAIFAWCKYVSEQSDSSALQT